MKTSTLKSAIEFAINTLGQFAREPHFWQKFEVAFGQKYNRVRAKEIYQAAVDGTFILPIRILDDQLMSMAVGAFSATTDTIYLKSSFVSGGDVAAIGAVILEELGHAIDAQVNRVETPGDEGAIFSLLVCGGEIAADLLAKLRAEDDWGRILVDGQELMVEMAVINGSDDPEDLIGTIDSDLINALGGDDTINSGFVSVVGSGYGGSTTVIEGSEGQDTIDGGDGTDTLVVDYSDNTNINGSSLQGIKYSSYNQTNGSGVFYAYKGGNSSFDQVTYTNIEKFNITGTQYGDDIRGGNADDSLIGGAGNDTLNAGIGNNTIDGGDGNDLITAASSNNTISGGDGNDSITVDNSVSIANSLIDGGAGNDTLVNANFSAAVTGLSFDNIGVNTAVNSFGVFNIENFINLSTGSGNDSINFIQSDSNTIKTGDGDDTINAGLGQDNVDGGSGTDTLVVDYSDNTNINGGSLQGIKYNSYNQTNGSGVFYAYKDGNSSFDQVTYTDIEKFSITGTQYGDDIRGGNADDSLIGGAGNDTIDAGTGNDSITAASSNNTISGGDGNDSITVDNSVSIANSSVDGGAGNDTLVNANFSAAVTGLSFDNIGVNTAVNSFGVFNIENFINLSTGSGNDSINFIQSDSNTIKTGDGDDTINAGLGQDNVDGGSGTDTLVVDYSDNTNINGSSLQGIKYNSYSQTNGSGVFYAYKGGNSSFDQVTYTDIEKFNITGTQYGDDIRGGNADDSLIGGAGNDTIDAGTGNNTIDGGEGNDSITAASSNNTISGGDGNDSITVDNSVSIANSLIDGGAGNDTLVNANFSAAVTGLSFDNIGVNTAVNSFGVFNIENFINLSTGSGNDSINFIQSDSNTIKTGDGDDTINAGLGQDNVDGGSGTDTLVVDYSDNTNINGSSLQGIKYNSYSQTNGSGVFYAYKGGNSSFDQVTYTDIEKFNITGTQYGDDIRGGNADDSLIGGAGNDTIDAGTGNNTIDGGEGNDSITAASSNNTISGGDGNDSITVDNSVSIANSLIDGGAGNDTLVNANFSAAVTGLSFDNIGVNTAVNSFGVFNIENFINLSTGSGNDSINFIQSDSNTIKTGDGDDTINAGLGQDNVDGGSGTDTLVVDYSDNTNINGGSLQGIKYNSYNQTNGSGVFYAYKGGNSSFDQVTYTNIEKFNITGTQYGDDIRGGNADDSLIGGAGNDTLNAGIGNNTIDGGDGNDLILAASSNNTISGGDGNDSITVDNSVSIANSLIDGGAGNDTLVNANFSAAVTGLSFDNIGVNTAVNSFGVFNIESFINLSTGSGNDSINFIQSDSNTIKTGDGDDTINAGLGQDNVDGGSGTDTLVVDYSDNTNINGSSLQGIKYNSYSQTNGSGVFYAYKGGNSSFDQVTYTDIEKFNITGTQYGDDIRGGNADDSLIGGAGNDTIDAGTGNDIINGISLGRASNNGTSEIDSLRGGAGSDRFILGNSINSYYDDQSISTSGSNDYALIADFNPNEDRIQLHGAVSDYRLEISGTNTNLYIDRAATEPDELIGVFQNITGLDLASTAFQYVAAINNISFSANTYNLSEGNLAQITLYRLGDNIGQNSITLNLTNGSATATADYVNTPIVVTFNDGESSKIVDIPIVDDLILENTENLLITLANPTNGATIGTDSQANLIIADNEINQAITLTNSNPVVVSNVFLNTANRNKVPSEIIYTVTNTPDTGVLSLDSNQALSFSSGNYVGNYETFASIQDNFTMEFWVNPTATRTVTPESNSGISGLNSGQSYVIGPLQGSPSSNVNAGVSVGTNGVSVFEHRSSYLPSTLVHNTNISGWNHVAIVYNNKQPSLYLNGQFVKAGLTSSYIVHPSALLGGLVSYGPFQGELDDVRIWNVARTPTEIQSNYSQALIGNEAGLSGYWNFSNVSGNIARDATTNAHNGNIVGATAVSSPILSSFNPLQVGDTFTQADINSGKLSYKPTSGVSGQDSFIFSVSDGSSTVANQTFNFINSPPAILSFSQPTYSVSEDGTTNVSITVTRTGGTLDAVSANVILSNGTAITTTDFNGNPITVTFAAGDTAPKTIIVPIADDPLFEGDETVNLTLANLTGGAVLGLQNTAVLTITNNDLPQPGTLSFASNNYNVNENGVPNVTVVRSGGSNGVVTIDIALANGTAVAPNDYNNIPISISFADGEISKVVELSSLINDDTIYEQPETIALALFQPTGGATIGSQSTTTLSVIDNDAAPGTVQFSTTSYSVAEDGSAFAAILKG